MSKSRTKATLLYKKHLLSCPHWKSRVGIRRWSNQWKQQVLTLSTSSYREVTLLYQFSQTRSSDWGKAIHLKLWAGESLFGQTQIHQEASRISRWRRGMFSQLRGHFRAGNSLFKVLQYNLQKNNWKGQYQIWWQIKVKCSVKTFHFWPVRPIIRMKRVPKSQKFKYLKTP